MTSDWFPGAARDADHESFLVRLRERAQRQGLVDVAQEDTEVLMSSTGFADLVVAVRAPGLPTVGPRPVLQAGYSADDQDGLHLIGGWETHGYLLDGPTTYEPAGSDARPADVADDAFEWLSGQLRRPVELLEFPGLFGGRQSRWAFADTGEELCRAGAWLRRRRRPSRVVRVR